MAHHLRRKNARDEVKLNWAKTSNSRSFQIDRMARVNNNPGSLDEGTKLASMKIHKQSLGLRTQNRECGALLRARRTAKRNKMPFARFSNTLTFQLVRILRVKHTSADLTKGQNWSLFINPLTKDQDTESKIVIVAYHLRREKVREEIKLTWAKTSKSRSFQIDRMARVKHKTVCLTKERN